MNYIVLDLEWNQGNGRTEPSKDLTFEIIEIGAVKYSQRMEMTDSFHELVRPQIHREMHRITGEKIHLNMEELKAGEPFRKVAGRFLLWCGQPESEPFTFCTWGPQDLTELQRNMKFYGMEPLSDGPIPYLDVQKLFSIAYEDRKKRRSLEFAVDFLRLEKDIPFHRAYSDAYYTGKVLAKCSDPQVMRNVSFDVYHPPADRASEIKIQFDTYEKYISRQFHSRGEALADREVLSSRCYLCHRNLRKKIKWFCSGSNQYCCLAHCEEHGYLKGKIRVRKTDDGGIYIVKTTKLVPEEEACSLAGRSERLKENRRRHQ